jgi:simple sugar transport system permease protein
MRTKDGLGQWTRRLAPLGNTIAAVLLGVLVASFVIALTGYDPLRTFSVLLEGSLGSPKYLANVVIKATPILLTGISVTFAFQVGLFNIGAEGQYIAGTVAAAIVGVLIDLPAPLQVPLVLLSGALAGAAVGGLIGWLKARFGIHEVISSIMCNWMALYLCNFVVSSETFHLPNSYTTYPIHASGQTTILGQWKLTEEGVSYLLEHPLLRDVLLKCDLNIGFLVAIAVAVVAGRLLAHTQLGYELRAVGRGSDAARFAGINVSRSIVVCLLISGGIAGLAGALTISGTNPHALGLLAMQEGYGFSGMSVAFIAGCSTLGCIPASLFFATLSYGGMSVQQILGVPSEVISVMVGTIVLFCAIPQLAPRILDWLGFASVGYDHDVTEA